jgi:hypothetical protein
LDQLRWMSRARICSVIWILRADIPVSIPSASSVRVSWESSLGSPVGR